MKKNILLVEDNERLRKNLLFVLNEEGYNAIGAKSGTEALALVKTTPPDLVISDIMMPDMDGYTLLEQLRAAASTTTIPVIFLTAKVSSEEVRNGMLLGVDDYLTKPVNINDLLKAITTRIERQEQQQRKWSERIERTQQHLTTILPHELRTPVNGILGGSSLIRSEIDNLSKEDIKELVQCIEASAGRLVRITENFLLYSEIRSIVEHPAFTPIVSEQPLLQADSLIEEIVLDCAAHLDRGSDIEFSLDNASFAVAQRHIEKVVSEVCRNALTFSPPGSKVRVHSRLPEPQTMELGTFQTAASRHSAEGHNAAWYILDITDEGRGLTEEQIRALMEPFSAFLQFDRKRYEQQGTGLGLALTRSIVELYGGYFHIASTADGDRTQTTVSVGFPLWKS